MAEVWFKPYAQDNQILQDYGERVTTRYTLVTETSWQIFDRFEAALEGFDAEIGWRLPVIEAWVDTRLFVGYQYFDNPFGEDYKGAKGRLEMRLFNDLLTLDAHLYEDEVLNLTDYLVGVRLRLPLGLPGGMPASRHGNGGELDARLTEMVMRDPKVQTRVSGFVANPDQQGVITESQTSVSQDTDKEGSVVLVDDVVFVDGRNGNDANSGTAESPMETIQGGVDSAYGQQNVYVYEGTYNTVINVNEGVSLMGSGCLIPGIGGQYFGSGTRPVINGGEASSVVTLQDNTLVQGFEIVNGGVGNGILSAAENLVIRCNYIHDTLVGVRVDRLGDLNVLLENNSFMNNGTAGAWISGTGASGSYFVNSRGNSFTANGPRGLHLTADNYDAALAIIHGNYTFENDTGIDVELDSAGISLLSITGTRADNNNASGIRAAVNSDMIAAALVGTPAALLGMVGDVVGLPTDMEDLLASSGPVYAGENDGHGIELNVQGGMIGAAALFDVRASGNAGDGAHVSVAGGLAGIGLMASSQNTMELLQLGANAVGLIDPGLVMPVIPASPLGPCVFDGNGGDGINMGVVGYDFSLGSLLDGRANNNAVDGVDLGVHSAGVAIALMGSTDPLRSLVEVLNTEAELDVPLVIPGDPWGPFEASGNGANGVIARVIGDNLAIGVLLDIRADSNQDNGGIAHIWSQSGTAIGLAGSSDTLFEVVPPILGELLGGAPDDIAVPDYAPMGPMTASGNGNGGFAMQVHGSDAFALVGGVQADNNLLGSGVELVVTATNSDAFTALYDVTANNNAEQGVVVAMASLNDIATLSMIDVTTEGNAAEGIRIDATADNDAYVLLTGVEANGNGAQGIRVTASSSNDIGMAFSAVNATGNTQQGLLVDAEAYEDVFAWIGDTSLDAFRDEFGSYEFLGASNSLYYLMTGGPSSFSGNGKNGAELNLLTDIGDIGISTIGNTFNDNYWEGLKVDMGGAGSSYSLYGEGNVIAGNNHGLYFDSGPLPLIAAFDFCGGILGSPGQNSIYDNINADVANNTPGLISAQHNYWGGVAPITGGLGPVDVTNPLTTDPNP